MGTKLSKPSKLQLKDMQSPKSPCASINSQDEYKITSCIPVRDKDSKLLLSKKTEGGLTVFITRLKIPSRPVMTTTFRAIFSLNNTEL